MIVITNKLTGEKQFFNKNEFEVKIYDEVLLKANMHKGKVKCYCVDCEFTKTFKNATIASKEMNCNTSHISQVINKRINRNTHGNCPDCNCKLT